MRTVAAVALVVGLWALPVLAQRGASHGGFSAHPGSFGHASPMRPSAPAGHPGPVSHSSPMGFMAPPANGRPVSPGRISNPGSLRFGSQGHVSQSRPPYPGYSRNGARGTDWNHGGRDRDHDRDHHRRPYWRGYEVNLGYGYLGWPGYPFLWNGPGYFGFDDLNYDTAPAPYLAYNEPVAPGDAYGDAATASSGYAGDPAPYNYGNGAAYGAPSAGYAPGARQPYAGSNQGSPWLAPQQAVTVIFNDGRPSEQIHNYLITPTTLTVLDQKYREIPLDQINLTATTQTNRADGVDFQVPGGSR